MSFSINLQLSANEVERLKDLRSCSIPEHVCSMLHNQSTWKGPCEPLLQVQVRLSLKLELQLQQNVPSALRGFL